MSALSACEFDTTCPVPPGPISPPGLMYCGGAAPVVAQLKEVSHEMNIPLSVESFAWAEPGARGGCQRCDDE
eukprot:6655474-Pyramimonas_sp.AAC.1